MESLEHELFGSDTESMTDNESNHSSGFNLDTEMEKDPVFRSIMECTSDEEASSMTLQSEEETPKHDQHPHIPGLCLHTNVLSHEDQSRLMQVVIERNFFNGGVRNQAMCFGEQNLAWLRWLDDKLRVTNTLSEPFCRSDWTSRTPLFDQSIINLYHPGDGIKPHVDLSRFEDGIIIVSLMSAITMDFYPALNPMTPTDAVDGEASQYAQEPDVVRKPTHSLRLEPGSIVTMQGPARYEWEHGIREITTDIVDGGCITRKVRVSITLRKMRPQAWEIGTTTTNNGVADR